MIFLEYAVDVAKAAREQGIKSVAVTAGYISENAREEFFSVMDAANNDVLREEKDPNQARGNDPHHTSRLPCDLIGFCRPLSQYRDLLIRRGVHLGFHGFERLHLRLEHGDLFLQADRLGRRQFPVLTIRRLQRCH